MRITKRSDITQHVHTREVPVDPFDWDEWVSGKDTRHIQDAFPYLDADDREFLLTGITPEEWTEFMGSEDEDEDEWSEEDEDDFYADRLNDGWPL